MPFMPHQLHAAMIFGEFDPDTGIPFYRETIVTWPRQTGKTVFVLAVETERCTIWEEPQRVIYTAQTGSDARKKLLIEQAPVLEAKMERYVKRVYYAKGEEAVVFRNGSRIDLAASSKESGHGATIDLGVLDECWADEDNRREQTILPMIKTRPKAQLLVCSTQGTEASTFLNRKTEIGRAAAAADIGRGIAYVEYSVPEDADIANPDVWWQYMPGLGYTITEDAIAHDLLSMEESEFRRADCNQCVRGAENRVFPEALWEAVQNPSAEVSRDGAVMFGLDVHPERASSAIYACDGSVLELIDHKPGTNWVLERAQSLYDRWGGSFVIDGGGLEVLTQRDSRAAGLPVVRLSFGDLAAACGRMYDAIADARVTFRSNEATDIAVAGLAKRPVTDRFVWARQASSTDPTPFVAATLALAKTPEASFDIIAF